MHLAEIWVESVYWYRDPDVGLLVQTAKQPIVAHNIHSPIVHNGLSTVSGK